MLTRLWAALTSGLKTEDLSSLHVTQWQNHKKVLLIYLLWRWISAIVFLAIIVCSSIDIGRDKSEVKHENHDTKWWIYLTNWTILLCMVQAWLAALIVTKALMDNNRDYGEGNKQIKSVENITTFIKCRNFAAYPHENFRIYGSDQSRQGTAILLGHILVSNRVQLHCVSQGNF